MQATMKRPCSLLFKSICLRPSSARCGLALSKAGLSYLYHQRPNALSAPMSKSTNSKTSPEPAYYHIIEDVERMGYYSEGGYHPVQIGDYYNDRYRVVHKLGHGGYSTIWLARDEVSNRYVAVKINMADSNNSETDIMSRLSNSSMPSEASTTMIPLILDTFNIQGPNGKHACLVMNVARMTLCDAKEASWLYLFQIDVARAMAAQLAMVIHSIHSQGFVHGDLNRGNILFQIESNLDGLSTKELYEAYEEPILEEVTRSDGQPPSRGVPKYGVVPIWLGTPSEKVTLAEARILLSDFGQAFSPSKEKRYESCTPIHLRPPETRFEPKQPLTFPSDIWTLACTIWDMVSQRTLFDWFLVTEDNLTCQQMIALGPLPTEWWEKWEGRPKYFTDEGQRKQETAGYESLEGDFERFVQKPRIEAGMPPLEPAERNALLAMLRSMLTFKPENRPTAQQVLESEWMVKWALPEYERMKITES